MEHFELLKKYDQEHLLQYLPELTKEEGEELLRQIEEIDFSLLDELKNKSQEDRETKNGVIEPLGALEIAQIAKDKDRFEQIGLEAIRAGKVAALLLGGGMGTRLGFDGPKGTYNLGVTRDFYIFQAQIQNMLDVCLKAGTHFELFIMTSDKNDAETRRFLKENDYFGYPEEKIAFFRQDMAPSCDFDGKIYLEEKGRISLSPNGNGGWYQSMIKAGLDQKLAEKGIEWINVFSVDNVLQRICDPVFVGATILSERNCGAKVVSKARAEEKVGVLCLKDSLPTIVEYYEMGEKQSAELDEQGNLKYRFGVILNYLFRVQRMNEIVNEAMPLHIVKKKIPYINKDGVLVKPEEENGYKFEYLATDTVRDMLTCLPFEVEREREFAPIKNKEGIDSVESARELLRKNNVIF